MENGGDYSASVAGASSVPPAAAPITDGNTVGVDNGTRDGGVAAASSPTTKPAAAPAVGCSLRSAVTFLQRTAGAIAAGLIRQKRGEERGGGLEELPRNSSSRQNGVVTCVSPRTRVRVHAPPLDRAET